MTRHEESRARSSWYESVQRFTKYLVNIRSVSPGEGERTVAHAVRHLLCEGDMESAYTEVGLDSLEGDPYGRHNAYALLRGMGTRTLVLLGHIDTVGTQDYGPLESFALDPDALAAHLASLQEEIPELAADMQAFPNDWMFGRGAADMKSGVAINIAMMRHAAARMQIASLPVSLVFLAVVDEENESAGVLQAVRFLVRLREQYGLDYVGAINTDYTTALYPGDPHRYIYTGTVGKLLPSFFVIGNESHVGHPFQGLDATLIMAELLREISMNDTLCDKVRGQLTAPPVTLHASDLKTHYDVQLPYTAWCYFNVMTLTTTPHALLERLRASATTALTQVLQRVDATEARWRTRHISASHAEQPRTGTVFTYAELVARAVQRRGVEAVTAALQDEWKQWPATIDARERSLHQVTRLWRVSGLSGPTIVLFYAPPYYPHVAASPSLLHQAIEQVCQQHPEQLLVTQEFFPFLSDLSYLSLDPELDIAALKANMPLWVDETMPPRSGAYHLPLAAMRELSLPVINLGPYGKGAHQRDERVLMSYSFGVLPQLLWETIERVGQLMP